MKDLHSFVWILIFTIMSTSCSKGGKRVGAEFVVTGFAGSPIFTGGLIVWGEGPEGKKLAVSLADESEFKEVLLEQGSWSFFATGWEGATPLTGTTRCGLTQIDIEGTDVVINLSMEINNCINEKLAPAAFMLSNQFKPIRFIVCNDISGATQGNNCDGTKGRARSFRFVFKDNIEGEVANGLLSNCYDETGASSMTNTPYSLPLGFIGNSPIDVTVESFDGLGCSGEKKEFEFINGITNGIADALVFAGPAETEVFIEFPEPPPVIVSYTNQNPVYTIGTAIASNSIATSGGPVVSYNVASGPLPVGLTLNSSTGEITGTPTTVSAASNVTIQAVGIGGVDSIVLSMTVNDIPPSITGYTTTSATYINGVAITLNDPTMAGGTATAFSVLPAMPLGLSFNTTTGQITGTPSGTSINTTYTVTATNSGGSNNFTLDIEVLEPGTVEISENPLYDFGDVATAASSLHLFTLTNTGGEVITALSGTGLTAPYSFSGAGYPGGNGNCSGSIAPGADCLIEVQFSPLSAGLISDTITINYNNSLGAATATRAINGTGVSPAILLISETDPYDYGSKATGSQSTHTFMVTNTGGVSATAISSSSLTAPFSYFGGGFPGTGGNCSDPIPASTNCTVVVSYQPTATGVHNDTIDISYNNGSAVDNALKNVTGTGVAPAILTFIEGSADNMGIGSAYSGGLQNDLGLWNASSNTPFISDGSGNSGDYYSISVGGARDLGSNPQDFNSGDVVVYDGNYWRRYEPPVEKTYTLNHSGGGVSAESIVINPLNLPFEVISDDCGTTLAIGASCAIDVRYVPASIGVTPPESLSVSYDDGATAQNTAIDLTGKAGRVVKIAGGKNSNCALFDNGQIKCWGDNTYGQLGIGSSTSQGTSPVEMGTNLNFIDLGTNVSAIDIVGGDGFYCVQTFDRQVKCWGRNDFGQLGLDSNDHRGDDPGEMGDNLPYVNVATTMKKIVAGSFHACIIRNNDQVSCWGRNNVGQLGRENTTNVGDVSGTPILSAGTVDLGSPSEVKEIAIGQNHSCAILIDNTLKCWGQNINGQLGLGSNPTIGDGPTEMGTNLPTVNLGAGPEFPSKVMLGVNSSCVLFSNDSIKCWGQNTNGQLGQGDTAPIGNSNPTEISAAPIISLGGGTISSLSATLNDEYCVKQGNQMRCWGKGLDGGLGKENANNIGDGPSEMGGALTPIDLGGAGVVEIGYRSTCAILDTYEVKCWGKNNQGQLGLGSTANQGDNAGEMGINLPSILLR